MVRSRDVLSIVAVGHVDHGKSTVIGRLLYDTKSLTEGAIEKVKRIAQDTGKPFEYAYLLDAFEEEQKQGITIDTTQLQFQTAKRDYIIIDAPGHKEFLKNMISGAASAEAALLIIDGNEGIQEQSKRHGYLLSLLGIQKIYVLVNKMDLIDYSLKKFNAIKTEMNDFLHNLHVYPLKYIPISAFYGDNIIAHSDKMPWYQDASVLEAIDLLEKDPVLDDKELRFPIQDVYKFDNRRILAGRIESGTLKVGDKILISPNKKVTTVKTIESWGEKIPLTSVSAGQSVGITVTDEFFNQRGEIITHLQDSPLIANAFRANVFWMGKKSLVKNREYKLKLVTQEIECEIQAIISVTEASTLNNSGSASEIKTNDVAEVIIKTKKKICFDEFKKNPHTGRFVIVDGFDVCGGGIISGLVASIATAVQFAKGEAKFAVACFDDYFYVLLDQRVTKLEAKPHIFSVGDVLPLAGKTYEYPNSFDVIDIKTHQVAKIRKARLADIVAFSHYTYQFLPMIDSSGCAIKIASQEEWVLFKSQQEQVPDSSELDFNEFRKVGILTALAVEEYQI
jgi:sulfate adenylyltransferase subunit 1